MNKILTYITIFIVIVAVIFIFLSDINSKKTQVIQNNSTSTPEAIEMCYQYSKKTSRGFTDRALLKMSILGNKVTGEYQNLPAEKDSKVGKFNGTVGKMDPKISGRIADVFWDSFAEGMQVTEQLKIEFGEGSAVAFFGEMINRGDGVYIYKDVTKLTSGFQMSQTDCSALDAASLNNKSDLMNSLLSESEARVIAQKYCIKGGEALKSGVYNKNSKTWWYDANLNATREGCNPACVVSEETKTAEINWRCTGLLPLNSGVEGIITIGPTCPVERIPPDLNCADRPYATSIQVISVGSPRNSPFTTSESDKAGKYKIMLPPGEYVLQTASGSVMPQCETKSITIEPSKIIKVNISCDSGVR